MSSDNFTPNYTDLGAVLLLGTTVDESDTLSQVELGVLGVVNALNLQKRNVGVGDMLRALVAQVTSLCVQPSVGGHLQVMIPWLNGYRSYKTRVGQEDFSAEKRESVQSGDEPQGREQLDIRSIDC